MLRTEMLRSWACSVALQAKDTRYSPTPTILRIKPRKHVFVRRAPPSAGSTTSHPIPHRGHASTHEHNTPKGGVSPPPASPAAAAALGLFPRRFGVCGVWAFWRGLFAPFGPFASARCLLYCGVFGVVVACGRFGLFCRGGCLVSRRRCVPSWGSVLSVGPWSGAAGAGWLRPSSRSLSGWVACVPFVSVGAAGAFAAAFAAGVLPAACGGVRVRRVGSAFVASVPVSGVRLVACRWPAPAG